MADHYLDPAPLDPAVVDAAKRAIAAVFTQPNRRGLGLVDEYKAAGHG